MKVKVDVSAISALAMLKAAPDIDVARDIAAMWILAADREIQRLRRGEYGVDETTPSGGVKSICPYCDMRRHSGHSETCPFNKNYVANGH